MSSSIDREVQENLQSHWPPDLEPDPSDWCIYRVPHSIRKGKEEACTPQIVSIGPLHCHKEELRVTEKQKERYVEKFFKRTEKKREQVIEIIEARERQIRNCYSETSNLESHAFVSMILRDAIFILEFLLRNYEGDENDKLLRIAADKLALKLDLLLLENQLPYFLLEELHNSIISSPSFIDICWKFFRSLFFYPSVRSSQNFLHFTDILRYNLVQNFPADEFYPVNSEYYDLQTLPGATKLLESGVKFTAFSSWRLLWVGFEGGELRMTRFLVHHQTETMLSNIIALEQCHYPRRPIVCEYVVLLDSLIKDERDAQLLVDERIISNPMGDCKALVSLFKKLRTEIPLGIYCYNKIYKGLNDYHNSKYNRNMAKLQRLYFPDIWTGTATIGAFVLLILTLIQTITSFK